MTAIALRDVDKTFGSHQVLSGLHLEVAPGEIVTVFGPSGCGKSLLLRLIAGVYEPTRGDIAIGGQSMAGVPPEQRGVGMAFQTFALYPHMSAMENIASPLKARGSAGLEDKVRAVARLLKIDHVLSHRPRELSNGQKQRTALSRALVAEPGILLLDDPLRNVDAKLRYEMRLELPRLLRGRKAAVLYVTQDYKEAMALGDRIAVMIAGRFVQVDTPAAIYDRPATTEVARLFGDPTINLVPATVTGGRVSVGGAAIDLAPLWGDLSGREVTVGIRPEAVTVVGDGGSGMSATLQAISPFNERVVLFATLADGREFLASAPIDLAGDLKPGPVRFAVDPARLHLFDKDGSRIAPRAETLGTA